MDVSEVERWFVEYLDTFAACCRGEGSPGRLLAYYGVPLLLTTDEGLTALTTEDEVVELARRQVGLMQAADYDHTELLEAAVTVLNASSALHRARLVRLRRDGTEIARLGATYLVTASPAGRRISALVLHSD